MIKNLYCILLGVMAGLIDLIPMMIMKLTWDANLSALSMWVIISFFLCHSSLKFPGLLKGLIYSLLALLPSAVLIGWNDPSGLIPVIVMTLLLGSLLGIGIDKIQQYNPVS